MDKPAIPVKQATDVGRVFPSGVRIGETSYGLGVFAFAFIPKETPIARVAGNIIDVPDYGSDYCIDASDNKVLEPAPPFCYLNHSCEPNCQLVQYIREANLDESETLETGTLNEDDLNLDDTAESADDVEEECYYGGSDDEPGCVDDTDVENEEDETVFANDADAEIWVETIHDILPDEELCIDYAWSADRAVKCLCGKPTCRGWVVAPDELHLLTDK